MFYASIPQDKTWTLLVTTQVIGLCLLQYQYLALNTQKMRQAFIQFMSFEHNKKYNIHTYSPTYIFKIIDVYSRSQWSRGLRRRSTAAHLLRSWVRIPPGAWVFVCCDCCVLSGRGLCDGLITRPEESYRLWRVGVCDQETSYTKRLQPRQRAAKYKPTMGCNASRKKIDVDTNTDI